MAETNQNDETAENKPDPATTINGVPVAGSRPNDGQHMEDEEKVLAGRTDVNMPALLTKDVKGG